MNNPATTQDNQPAADLTVPQSIKDLNTEQPRWCVGCGDFGILMGLKRFLLERRLPLELVVNVSGIGCSGRAPNYINTYGVHSIHGRAPAIALGLALTRPDLHVFIHSGDGDALSIGGNHLLHAVHKNFNCVFILYDNEIYALTKNQSSPTTRQNHPTNTQPDGTFLPPVKPVRFALGVGASFVASTADWLTDHFLNTLRRAFDHRGFSFVHVSQRCPHFDPSNFDHKNPTWFSFLTHEDGIPPDKRWPQVEQRSHDPQDLSAAFQLACDAKKYFGLFYIDPDRPRYDELQQQRTRNATPYRLEDLLNHFKI